MENLFFLLGYDFGECDDEEEDDPDALQDPIYQMDLQVSIVAVIKQWQIVVRKHHRLN